MNNVNNFQKGNLPAELGRYFSERAAYQLESQFLKEASLSVYSAYFAQVLSNLARVLFEIELYNNPNQKPSKLFAKMINKCFFGAKQKINYLYMLEERLLYRQFTSFPHAVADVNVISVLIKKPANIYL